VTTRSNLANELRKAAALLRGHAVDFWAVELESDAARLEGEDPGAAKIVLARFGGMGSLNDLWICRTNGHLIDEKSEEAVNKALSSHRSRIFELARDLAN
jgi:hypothetical protein